MASAACNHLHTDSLPVVDLRLLSQSELLSLSFCSSCSSYSLHNDADVSIPKIDRSVFNESAGSRKQTFSRLRLAPRPSSTTATSPHFSPSPFYRNPPLDEENHQIISLLKSLFGSSSSTVPDDGNGKDNLVPVPIQYNNNYARLPHTNNSELQNIQTSIVDEAFLSVDSLKKRKRGRPPRHANNYYSFEVTESGMKEMPLNGSAQTEEKEVLGGVEDPFREELRKRTVGLISKPELLGFLEGLDGEWMSKRKKKMVVDAGVLAGALPKGWKLIIAFKKRANNFWLKCRRYLSPNGQQFMSFKEVSLYLLSVGGDQDASQLNIGHADASVVLTDENASGNDAGLPIECGKNGDLMLHSALPAASNIIDYVKEDTQLRNECGGDVQTLKQCKCHKCPFSFDEKDDLLQHLLSAHHRVPKRLRPQNSVSEERIIINGKYECQICDKLFEERHRFNGHLGIHIKDYFKRLEVPGRVNTIQNSTKPASVGFPSVDLVIQKSIGMNNDSVALTSNFEMNDEMSSAISSSKPEAKTSIEINCGKQEMNRDDVVGNEKIVCSDAESTLVNHENTSNKSSIEADILRCNANGVNTVAGLGKNCKNYSLTPDGRDSVFPVDSNTNQVPTSFVEEHDDRVAETNLLAPKVNTKTSTNDVEIDAAGLFRNEGLITSCVNGYVMQMYGKTDVKEQRNSKCSSAVTSVNDQKHGLADDAMELFTSVNIQESGLRKFLYSISKNSLTESKLVGEGKSGDNQIAGSCGSNSIVATVDNVTSNEQMIDHGNGSIITSPDNQMHLVEDNSNENPNCLVMKSSQERDSVGHGLTGIQQSVGFINNLDQISNCTSELFQPADAQWSMNSEFRSDISHMGGHITNMEVERNFNSLPITLANRQTSLNEDGICKSNPETAEQYICSHDCRTSSDGHINDSGNNVNKVSCMMMEEENCKDNGCFCNGKPHVTFGGFHPEKDESVGACTVEDSYSKTLMPSENQDTIATKDNAVGIRSGPVDELKQKGDSVDSLLYLTGSEQAHRTGNNLCRGSTGTLQEEPRLQGLKSPDKNKLENGFTGLPLSSENSASEFIWRTDANELLTGFADTSTRLGQSSNCFPAYEVVSDKGGCEIFGEKFDGTPGFEQVGPVRSRNMECNFLTSGVNSHSNESQVFQYDAEISHKFDLPVWLQKEALPVLPKMPIKQHFPSVCAWCKNELQHEPLKLEAEMGSMGFSCDACKAKAPGQFNLLQNVDHKQFNLP